MMADCCRYYKDCEECQWFGNIQLVSSAKLHPIMKPWLFYGWGLDFHWPESSPIIKEVSFCLGCYKLFHQVDRGSSFEEYGTQGDN
jgi:hypothetical protein